MNKLLLISLLSILVGCTTIKNVSENPPFKSDVGIRHLVKDAFICAIDDKAMFEKDLPDNKLYENHGFKSCPYGTNVASLQKGEEIEIRQVSHRSHFGLVSYTDHWYYLGSADIDGKFVSFYYYMGLSTDGTPPADFKENLLWN